MATKRPGHSPARPLTAACGSSKEASNAKPIALTVKVDEKTHVRLRTLGATQRRTKQDLMKEAIQQYLDRVKA
jgi:predicted DNA-binding protein